MEGAKCPVSGREEKVLPELVVVFKGRLMFGTVAEVMPVAVPYSTDRCAAS